MLTKKPLAAQRLVTLDYLRGIAALAVMCLHMTEQIGAIHQYPGKIFSYGYLGVDLFFVISGFVIFFTLNSKSSPVKFIIARFSRLFPTYWFAVSFAMLMALVVTRMGWAKPELELNSYLFNLTMLQSLFDVKDIDVVYWTLTIELIFYIIIGLIFFLTRSVSHRYVLLLSYMIICLFYKLDRNFAFLPQETFMKKYLIINQIPYFITGIGLYVLRSSRKWGLLLILPAIMLINLTQWKKDHGISEILIIKNMIVLLVFLATWLPAPNWKGIGHTLLSFFGRISYPLYLLHSEFSWYFLNQLKPIQYKPLALLVTIIFVLTLSWLVHRYIETRLSDTLKKQLTRMWNKAENVRIRKRTVSGSFQ